MYPFTVKGIFFNLRFPFPLYGFDISITNIIKKKGQACETYSPFKVYLSII